MDFLKPLDTAQSPAVFALHGFDALTINLRALLDFRCRLLKHQKDIGIYLLIRESNDQLYCDNQ